MNDSEDRERWVEAEKDQDISVPSWYGSNDTEEKRAPTEDEIIYVRSKVRLNRYVKWVSILLMLSTGLFLFFNDGIYSDGSFVIIFSFSLISVFIYFIGEKYIPKKVDKNKKIRSISGRPRFPSGALLFYSGIVASLIVDGIRFRVPHHWALNLLPYDLGERKVEVEIYETKGESYALSIDGFSIEREAGNGLYDVLMDGRRMFAALGGVISGIYGLHIISEFGVLMYLGLEEPAFYRLPETWSAVFLQTPSLVLGGVALLLGLPALWLYVQHRKALSNIREMYREEGVIE